MKTVNQKCEKFEKYDNESLISVVVPAYQAENGLLNCVNSLKKQTYRKIEIIIVDDGSSDKTGILADLLAEESIKVKSIHIPNSGVTNARLTGVRVASGEWIGFVDSDDTVEPEMYQHLIENAMQYQAEISHCGYRTIVNNGERIHWFYNTGRLVLQNRETALKDLLEGSFIEPGLCNKLFHKSLFRDIIDSGQMDSTIRYNEDLLMNYYLFKAVQSAVYEDFCPYNYMANTSSATRNGFQLAKVMDPIKVRKTIFEDIEDKACQLKDIALRGYLYACRRGYESILSAGNYPNEERYLHEEILRLRDKWKLLNNKERYRIRLLMYMPRLYLVLERIWTDYFRVKRYE